MQKACFKLGCGWQRTRGISLGSVIDVREVERTICAAVGKAEEVADHHLRNVTVSFTRLNSHLMSVPWSVKGQTLDDGDLRGLLAKGIAEAATEDRDLLQANNFEYVWRRSPPVGVDAASQPEQFLLLCA